MGTPSFQTVMLPILQSVNDQQEHTTRDVIDTVAGEFGLSDEERAELLPSGQQRTFDNRVNWAISYLKQAGILERTRRSVFRITERGLQALSQNPARIDVAFLSQYPEFREFRERSRRGRNGHQTVEEPDTQQTPEELLEDGYQRIRLELAQELLSRIMGCSSSFFERLVVELLVKMGYGGSRKDAGEAIGRSGDEGIDGIIKEDRLGLDTIYSPGKAMARDSWQTRHS